MIRTESSRLAQLGAILVLLAAASVSPLIFPIAEAGYSDMNWLAIHALIPALAVLAVITAVAARLGWRSLVRAILTAVAAGIASTVGLEIVRIIGFRFFEAMPGSMPMLMGVLLTHSFMQGPSQFSNALGWADHFWNGASFALIYVLLLGRRPWWFGLIYAYIIATIFMMSPVVSAIGAGDFGQEFAPIGFPLTVYLAHTAFGLILGSLVARSSIENRPLWLRLLPFHRHEGSTRKLVDEEDSAWREGGRDQVR